MLTRCNKTIALIALVTGCFHAVNSLALGLGDLTVNSSLNEPLDASIQLLGLDGLTEAQIQASLGTLADFQRANIDRVGLIDDIQVEIGVFNAAEGTLHLTSDEPVVEPFLNMVISVRWPNGRLMRDYTALIDLPVLISDESRAVPVNIPQTPAPAPPQQESPSQLLVENEQPALPVTAPSTTPDAPVSPEEEPTAVVNEQSPQPESSRSGADEVIIESGDNLYAIAAANRPSNNVSVEQTMLAIQRANPDAFIDGNINRIRVGRVLRIPTLQEIQSIDQSQAVNQIALQNQAASTQPLALSTNTGAGNQQGEDELTILSGDEGTNTTGDSDLAATIAALENQLAISEENLDRARLENQELQARYADLEDQIEILQNIIAMQDARLAQLQADLAAASQAEPEPAVTETPVQAQPVSAQPAPQDNSLMGQLSSAFENTLVLVASLVALIVLVVGFLVWRRRAAQDEMDDFALEGAAVTTGTQATYRDNEPTGASSGFLAGMKSRFSRSADDSDDDVAEVEEVSAKDDDHDDFDDENDGGLLAKLKGIFSRSSDDEDDDDFDDEDDDDEFDDEDDDDDYEEDSDTVLDDDDDGDEFDEGSAASFAFNPLDEEDADSEDDETVEAPEAEFDLEFDADDDVDEADTDDAETTVAFAENEDGDDDDLDLGNLGDLNLDVDEESDAESDVLVVADVDNETDAAEDVTPQTFEFGLDDETDVSKPAADADADAEVESFDFALGDITTPAEEETLATDEESGDVESFEFNVSEAPVVDDPTTTSEEEADNVETFAFDVGSVSSFEEKADSDAENASSVDDEVETFDFDLDSVGDSDAETEAEVTVEVEDATADPLAAALDEIDAEVDATDADEGKDAGKDADKDEGVDEFDLSDIEIDDSLFDAESADGNAESAGIRDEASTKLDLAVAYEAMGDLEGARDILNEVISEGNDNQIAEAKKLLEKWDE